ncbi:NUDIX domain-containing protein [Microvirga arsenatis]|uniref:NUDIX domain-containing protein n=1 Tax=Microvirga arsenatis TaxID=2692265 RepID=A0ABW9Z2J0_9HYPH|nr:NUDIX domain-containing protein [Microvirga arsenatis]NBJ13250.1 NUDIX domain-containing protein [Microvirga arsenatis]NBJ26889.1 NUDIX domain-containing protein [Microvirga arsenatis]
MSDLPQPRPAARLVSRALHTYWRFARGMTLGVRGAVLDGQNRVFLIRHTYVPGWHLPGGGVETGETALEALDRELREEACIAMDEPPALLGVFFNRRASPRDHVLVYVIRRFTVLAEKRPDREIAEAGFFPLDRLPEGTTPATRRRLDEILEGQPLSATW